MKENIRKTLARICVLAVAVTTVFQGTVPVMANVQPQDISVITEGQLAEPEVYEDIADEGLVSGETDLLQEDITETLPDERDAGLHETGDILTKPENEGPAQELVSDPENIDSVTVSGNVTDDPGALDDLGILDLIFQFLDT